MDELRTAVGEMRTVARLADQQRDELFAELQNFKEQIEQFRAEAEREREGEAERQRQYEAEIRRGEHGAALQELQRRVDRKETSMPDVMDGTDDHWSAKEVRAQLIRTWRADVEDLRENDPEFAADYAAITDDPDRPLGEWGDGGPEPPAPTTPRPSSPSDQGFGGTW